MGNVLRDKLAHLVVRVNETRRLPLMHQAQKIPELVDLQIELLGAIVDRLDNDTAKGSPCEKTQSV